MHTPNELDIFFIKLSESPLAEKHLSLCSKLYQWYPAEMDIWLQLLEKLDQDALLTDEHIDRILAPHYDIYELYTHMLSCAIDNPSYHPFLNLLDLNRDWRTLLLKLIGRNIVNPNNFYILIRYLKNNPHCHKSILAYQDAFKAITTSKSIELMHSALLAQPSKLLEIYLTFVGLQNKPIDPFYLSIIKQSEDPFIFVHILSQEDADIILKSKRAQIHKQLLEHSKKPEHLIVLLYILGTQRLPYDLVESIYQLLPNFGDDDIYGLQQALCLLVDENEHESFLHYQSLLETPSIALEKTELYVLLKEKGRDGCFLKLLKDCCHFPIDKLVTMVEELQILDISDEVYKLFFHHVLPQLKEDSSAFDIIKTLLRQPIRLNTIAPDHLQRLLCCQSTTAAEILVCYQQRHQLTPAIFDQILNPACLKLILEAEAIKVFTFPVKTLFDMLLYQQQPDNLQSCFSSLIMLKKNNLLNDNNWQPNLVLLARHPNIYHAHGFIKVLHEAKTLSQILFDYLLHERQYDPRFFVLKNQDSLLPKKTNSPP